MSVETSVEQSLRDKLERELAPSRLEVLNESHRHSGPATESHFRVLIVSDRFAGQSRIARHRDIHRLLAEELAGGLHALAIEALTPEEWQHKGEVAATSPDCRGGSKSTSR